MADKLHFDLVSPERRLFAGNVDQVVVPGEEGDFRRVAEPRTVHVGDPPRRDHCH